MQVCLSSDKLDLRIMRKNYYTYNYIVRVFVQKVLVYVAALSCHSQGDTPLKECYSNGKWSALVHIIVIAGDTLGVFCKTWYM